MFDLGLGDLDPLARLTQRNPVLGQALARNRQGDPLPPLSKPEEQSILSRVGSAAMGGIGYAGEVLEKTFGGRAVRGLLGGKPRELLSILPGSDLAGITDPSERVTGKELLGYNKDDDSWGATLAGLGTEMALDPGMYLSFGGGALTGAGRAAKAAGTLPASLAARAEQGLGGLVGIGLPLSHPSVVLGADAGGAALARGAGAAAQGADALARSIPVLGSRVYAPIAQGVDAAGRYGRALFDSGVMGATSHAGQEAASEASQTIAPLLAQYRGKVANYAEELSRLGHGGRGAELREILEGTFHGPVQPEIKTVADAMRGDLKTFADEAHKLGVNIREWHDPVNGSINYFPRQQSQLARASGGAAPRQPLSALDDVLMGARDPIFEGFHGGTEGINQLVADAAVHQGQPNAAADYVLKKYLTPGSQANLPAPPPGLNLIPGSAEEAAYYAEQLAKRTHDQRQQALSLVDWARGLDPQYQQAQTPFFGHHPLADYKNYFERGARLLGAGEAGQNLLARTAVDASAGLAPGTVRLTDALQKAGLTGTGAAETLASRLGIPVQDLATRGVPQEMLAELARYSKPFSAPEAVNPVLGAFDTLTNLTKAFQTALWPSFHARNFASGWWSNLSKGGGSLDSVRDAYNLLKGGTIADAHAIPGLAGLSAEEATKALGREMYQHGIGGHLPHMANEIIGQAGTPARLGTALEDILGQIPGRESKSIGKALGSLATADPNAWNPLNTAGVGSASDLFAPVNAGRQIGDVVEGTNRGALYLSLRRQGWDPAAAAKAVLEAHFDYSPSAYTPFERSVMKRLVPYYSFSKGNIPLQLGQMLESPGGMAGTLARAAGDLRQQTGFLPDYLGQGLAIPLGGEGENGQQRFLTKLDMPPEQAFELLKGGPNWLQNSIEGVLGQTNPLIKGPLEYATGKQFFTGRDAGDLYSQTGSPLVDALIANSPASRVATTVRTLSDPRKWESPLAATAIPLNLLTGARVSDVDMEKQKDIAARDYVKAMLQGKPEFGTFQSIYMRPGMENLLSPEEMALFRLQKTLQSRKVAAGR